VSDNKMMGDRVIMQKSALTRAAIVSSMMCCDVTQCVLAGSAVMTAVRVDRQ